MGGRCSILFATSDRSSGLLRVPAGGGEIAVLTSPDAARGEEDHLFPSALPRKQAVLFTITNLAPGDDRIAVYDLKTREQRVIRSGSQAEYIDTGHLIFIDRGALWAIRFDLETLATAGDAVALNERVLLLGSATFAISRSGHWPTCRSAPAVRVRSCGLTAAAANNRFRFRPERIGMRACHRTGNASHCRSSIRIIRSGRQTWLRPS